MNIEEQVNILYKTAPRHGVSPVVMEKAVIPTLTLFANQLQHLVYFVFQTRDRAWLTTTLAYNSDPDRQKTVIYAFPRQKDATSFQSFANPNLCLIEIPVTHLLFQLLAMNRVDSILFMEVPSNQDEIKDIQRKILKNLAKKQIKRLKLSDAPASASIPPIPPDLA
jgi:hypothetical protein